MRVMFHWLLTFILLPLAVGQEPDTGVFVSAQTGFLLTDDDQLVAKLPIYTQLRVIRSEGGRLEVENDRFKGWIHKGQVRPQLTFESRKLRGLRRNGLMMPGFCTEKAGCFSIVMTWRRLRTVGVAQLTSPGKPSETDPRWPKYTQIWATCFCNRII